MRITKTRKNENTKIAERIKLQFLEVTQLPHSFEELSGRVLGAAVTVHQTLGPGFLDSLYQRAMEVSLDQRGIAFDRQREIHVMFEDVDVGFIAST